MRSPSLSLVGAVIGSPPHGDPVLAPQVLDGRAVAIHDDSDVAPRNVGGVDPDRCRHVPADHILTRFEPRFEVADVVVTPM